MRRGPLSSTTGPGIFSMIRFNSGCMEPERAVSSSEAYPSRLDAKRYGKSARSSSAPSSRKSSRISSSTSCGRASGRSILFTITTGRSLASRAFPSTKRVWGIGPSAASTSTTAPSAIRRTRSTSPPKSACPGVSIILILIPCHWIAIFFDNIVMPRSRSRSPESRMRSFSS